MNKPDLIHRPRRLRTTEAMRQLTAETRVTPDMLVEPHFIVDGTGVHDEIDAMPGIPQVSPDVLVKRVEAGLDLGLQAVLLFGIPDEKDPQGQAAADPEGPVATALTRLREAFGDEIVLMADVCLCEYTTHGHCGVLDEDGWIDNDASLARLAEAAVTYAEAGADWVAPSDMMDGRVAAIRHALDENGHHRTAILSYAAKYQSAFYGPFRHAQHSTPGHGDRSTYQMDPPNAREALREVRLDVEEGADGVMVKPGLAYLDVLHRVRAEVEVPVAVYNVSGEYAMVKTAASQGLLDEGQVVAETLTAMARAGADVIITYHARQALQEGWLP